MKTAKKPVVSVKTTVDIPMDMLSSLLCSAFEGGVGYWCQIQGYLSLKEARSEFKSLGLRSEDKEFRHIWVPLTESGGMELGIDEEDDQSYSQKVILDLKSIENGLNIMANRYPRHFNSIIEDNTDAETGDVFLQCCLLGEVVYG